MILYSFYEVSISIHQWFSCTLIFSTYRQKVYFWTFSCDQVDSSFCLGGPPGAYWAQSFSTHFPLHLSLHFSWSWFYMLFFLYLCVIKLAYWAMSCFNRCLHCHYSSGSPEMPGYGWSIANTKQNQDNVSLLLNHKQLQSNFICEIVVYNNIWKKVSTCWIVASWSWYS